MHVNKPSPPSALGSATVPLTTRDLPAQMNMLINLCNFPRKQGWPAQTVIRYQMQPNSKVLAIVIWAAKVSCLARNLIILFSSLVRSIDSNSYLAIVCAIGAPRSFEAFSSLSQDQGNIQRGSGGGLARIEEAMVFSQEQTRPNTFPKACKILCCSLMQLRRATMTKERSYAYICKVNSCL